MYYLDPCVKGGMVVCCQCYLGHCQCFSPTLTYSVYTDKRAVRDMEYIFFVF